MGTTYIGNEALRALNSDETDYLKCVQSTIAIHHRPALMKIPYTTLLQAWKYVMQAESSIGLSN